MCRDVKYIILLYSSLRNYHHTNTDATSHSVTTGNRWNQIKQLHWSVLIGDHKPSEIKRRRNGLEVCPTGRTSVTCRKHKTFSKQPFYVSTTLTICKISHLKSAWMYHVKERMVCYSAMTVSGLTYLICCTLTPIRPLK